MSRLGWVLPGHSLQTTADGGTDPQWAEAAAFTWLAHQRMHGLPSNLPLNDRPDNYCEKHAQSDTA